MDTVRKNQILQQCNTMQSADIKKIVQSGVITMEEFTLAGLDANIIKDISNAIRVTSIEQNSTVEKTKLLERVTSKKAGADEIRLNLNNNKYTLAELSDAGVVDSTINSLKHYSNSNRITLFKNVDDLPPMEEGRTDVYFVGMPGSGKSTMLSGLLSVASKDGILMADVYCVEGSVYQTRLITDLNRGVLPNATATGSYNYIALSLKDGQNKNHPFNVVEVPGELYRTMVGNADVPALLNYINNGNKKILIFVIDSLAHHTGYNDSDDQDDQSLVYVNILDMFKKNGVLQQTDAVYLVANKFDAIKDRRYPADNRTDEILAQEFLTMEFKSLIENCKNARDQTKNKFKIKILPYSIGSVAHVSILEYFNTKYSQIVIDNLISDSFIVKGGKWANIFK